jgi:hypothetical protein
LKITFDDLKFQHYCYTQISYVLYMVLVFAFLCENVGFEFLFSLQMSDYLVSTWCINLDIFMLCFICVIMVIIVNVNIGMHDMFVLCFLFLILCK